MDNNVNIDLRDKLIALEQKAMQEYCDNIGITEVLEYGLDNEEKIEYMKIYQEYFGTPINLGVEESEE